MTVYLDIVFLENLCMNYVILLATGLICKNGIKHLRLFLSSTIGSLYAVIAFLPILKIYTNVLLKIILSIAMIYLAFGPKNIKEMFKKLMVFYLTSFAFGGCAFALLYFVKPENIFMKNGVLVGTYPIKIAILGGLLGFTLIVTTFKIVKSKLNKKDMFCELEIILEKQSQRVIAMIDTGNMLKDPISRMPVVVVQKENLDKILPKEILENVERIIGGDSEKIINTMEQKEYISKFRVIPFSSLGKQHGLLLGFKADKVVVKHDENEMTFRNVIIGIYDKPLSKNNSYSALVGLDMLGEEEHNSEYLRNVKV